MDVLRDALLYTIRCNRPVLAVDCECVWQRVNDHTQPGYSDVARIDNRTRPQTGTWKIIRSNCARAFYVTVPVLT